ncbi:DUF6626 family protein [Magnetospirillum sp. ME-1]|uniref:DUF6626 family protein n=1 Tax=Magnetospirillum sp. ME-1 TaxID=1639348 RepID=UPI003FA6081F
MNYLQEAYDTLKRANLITSWDDLSTRYLLKSPSYARTQRAMGREISLEALASLASRLHQTGQALHAKKHGNLLGAADEISRLSDTLWAAVYRQSLDRLPRRRLDA